MRFSVVAGGAGVVALLLVVLLVVSSGRAPAAPASTAGTSGAGTSGAGTSVVRGSTGPAVRISRTASVTYVVSGTPGAAVSYGPSGADFSGQSPLRVSRPVGRASYYGISAQLQAGGSVACEIILGGTVISRSAAAGDYNVVSCQAARNAKTGLWRGTTGG